MLCCGKHPAWSGHNSLQQALTPSLAPLLALSAAQRRAGAAQPAHRVPRDQGREVVRRSGQRGVAWAPCALPLLPGRPLEKCPWHSHVSWAGALLCAGRRPSGSMSATLPWGTSSRSLLSSTSRGLGGLQVGAGARRSPCAVRRPCLDFACPGPSGLEQLERGACPTVLVSCRVLGSGRAVPVMGCKRGK